MKVLIKRGKFLFIFLWFVVSCVDQSGKRGRSGDTSDILAEQSQENSSGESTVIPQDNGLGNNNITQINGSLPQADIRHIVDPQSGLFKTKVSLPKNYNGKLYLSGLNISSLTDKFLKVKFTFGRDLTSITLDALVGRASGLVPQTNLEVLILDFKDQPFNNLRLLYDLYDYNIYGNNDEPVTDSRDNNLYCRGLNLEDDPTFQGSATNNTCDQAGEKCHYAYAKIVDQGPAENDSGNFIAINPSEPHLDLQAAASTLENDTHENMLKKCLPDNGQIRFTFQNNKYKFSYDSNNPIVNLNSPLVTANNKIYFYRGPYRPIDQNNWQIKPSASIFNPNSGGEPTGLFQSSLIPNDINVGVQSYLFPRSGKLALKNNRQYLGSNLPPLITQERTVTSLLSPGLSQVMDGCNLRVTHHDTFTGEGISSCNVTASISLLSVDPNTNQETIISTSKFVKLQLISPSLKNSQGEEVLFSSMRSCSNSNTCGHRECCLNGKCFFEENVMQCKEDGVSLGRKIVGESCINDLDCAGLCCNSQTQSCAAHNLSLVPEVLCQKNYGEFCIAKDWCKKDSLPSCFIVNTGVDAQFNPTCALRCYQVPTFGDCINNSCRPPQIPPIPFFDPNNPDCSTAITPLNFPEVLVVI